MNTAQARRQRANREARWDEEKQDAGVGAGSRGGHIIGRTKSGKPLYMNHKHPSHKEFSSRDHSQAAELHSQLGGKVSDKIGKINRAGPNQEQREKANQLHIKVMDHRAAQTHHLGKSEQGK